MIFAFYVNSVPHRIFKFVKVVAVILICCSIFACQTSEERKQKPEDCSTDFIVLLAEGDFEGAAKLATPESARSILKFSKTISALDEKTQELVLSGFENDRSSVRCQLVTENEAQCHVCCSENEEEAILDLAKINGQWFIASLFDI